MVGRTIGKYRVIEQIGRGGMGTVYKAIDETLDRRVAIKVLNADLIDQEAVERFRREAMTLAKLNHGRIGAIHELTRDGHDLLMVMEFLEGETFEKLIEKGPLPVPRAVMLCAQVLDALQYAHAAGVIHRDLKPANVILTPVGDVKVMDFGIARVQGSEHLTTSGFMVGTPAYMAPEQVRGEEVDPRMDLYAVAVVLYRLLTQRLPFSGDTAIAMIHSQLNNPPTPPRQFRADLPEWIVKILDRGLSKEPADRFQSAAEFRAAIEGGLTGKLPTPTGIMPADPDATLGPMLTPPSMRPPVTPSAVAASAAGMSPSAVAASALAAPSATAAVPQGAAAPKVEATVTLRAPHLATAGILLTLLVVGVGVLAFIALRRQAAPAVAPTVQVPVETPAAAADGAAAAALSAAVPPTAAPPPAPAIPAASTPQPPAASASLKPLPPASGGTPPPSAAGTTRPPARSGGSPAAAAPGAVAAAPVTAAGRSATVAAPAPAPAPALPAAAGAPAENFGDIKTLVVDGSRSRELDALLSLEPGTLVVRSRNDGAVLRTVPYSAVAAATYTRGRRPRGQATEGAVVVPDNVGGAGFLGGARHWLTLQTPTEYLIIRLEDRNVIRVLNSVEARTGSKVQRNQE